MCEELDEELGWMISDLQAKDIREIVDDAQSDIRELQIARIEGLKNLIREGI